MTGGTLNSSYFARPEDRGAVDEVLCLRDFKMLVALVSHIFPEFQFGWLAEETRRNLPLELDFVHEARNCEKVAESFSHLPFLKAGIVD